MVGESALFGRCRTSSVSTNVLNLAYFEFIYYVCSVTPLSRELCRQIRENSEAFSEKRWFHEYFEAFSEERRNGEEALAKKADGSQIRDNGT